jgi:hypothetical protein
MTPSVRFEVPVLGSIVDALLPTGMVIEVQTSGLGAIAAKVIRLARSGHPVRIIHPVVAGSRIIRLDPGDGRIVSNRKSPKKRGFYDVFRALVHAPQLLVEPQVSIEIPLVEVEDIRMNDGRGSWRRKGDRRVERSLVGVLGSSLFASPEDWLGLVPLEGEPWSSASLATSLGTSPEVARSILYTFAKAGLLVDAGKNGRFKLYGLNPGR